MSTKRRRQRGDSHAIILLVFVAVAATGGSGYVIFKANQKPQQQSAPVSGAVAAGAGAAQAAPAGPPTADSGQAAAGSLAAAAGAQQPCGYTPEVADTPYYISGSPALRDGELNTAHLDGTAIKVGGLVYGAADNTKPLANATVELWQADAGGLYHPAASGSAGQASAGQLSLRGYVTSNASGYYEFTSILPGQTAGRPRHISLRASAAGYQTVTTEIIASQPGDKTSPTANASTGGSGPSASPAGSLACSWLTFPTADSHGFKTGVFNIHLRPSG